VIFGDRLLPLVLSGKKTVTRRVPHREPGRTYQAGRIYPVQPKGEHWGGPHVAHIRALSVKRQRLHEITDGDAKREGFAGVAEFIAYWKEIHGDWLSDLVVMRIEFELAPYCTDCAPYAPDGRVDKPEGMSLRSDKRVPSARPAPGPVHQVAEPHPQSSSRPDSPPGAGPADGDAPVQAVSQLRKESWIA